MAKKKIIIIGGDVALIPLANNSEKVEYAPLTAQIISRTVSRWNEEESTILKKQDNLCIKTDFEIYKRTFTALDDVIIMTIPKQNFMFLKDSFAEFRSIFESPEKKRITTNSIVNNSIVCI